MAWGGEVSVVCVVVLKLPPPFPFPFLQKLKSKPPAPKRIKWDQCAYMFEDKDDDAVCLG